MGLSCAITCLPCPGGISWTFATFTKRAITYTGLSEKSSKNCDSLYSIRGQKVAPAASAPPAPRLPAKDNLSMLEQEVLSCGSLAATVHPKSACFLASVAACKRLRHRSCLYLCAPGVALGKELHELAAAVRGAVVQGLSTAEQTALRVSLRKIIANMDRFQERGNTDTLAREGS